MITATVILVVIMTALVWFIDGIFSRRMDIDQRDTELQDYYESETKND